MYKTKSGELITWKEFFKRWGDGIKATTPLQSIRVQLTGQLITISGVIWGLLFSWYLKQGWLVLILFGGLIVASVGLLASYQKYIFLNTIHKELKGGFD